MLPRINEKWKTCLLREANLVIMGQAPRGDSYNTEGSGTPLIAGAGDFGKRNPEPKKWTTSPQKVGQKGDLILCVRATIGDLNWADNQYCYGRGVSGIRPNSDMHPEFLWYWLATCKTHLLSLGRGAIFKQIAKTDIENLPIPLLPQKEQQRIVTRIKECLGKVDEVEALRKQNLNDAEDLLPALLSEKFEELNACPRKTIGDVCVETRFGTSKKCNTQGQGTPILRIPNVKDGLINTDDLKYCPLTPKEEQTILLQEGDLLFVRTNGSRDLVGRCAIFDRPETDYGYASYLIRVRLDKQKVLPEYLSFFLESKEGRKAIDERRRTSAGQFNINSENLRSITFPCPEDLSTQQKLVEEMAEARRNVHQLVAAFKNDSEVAALRESILHQAFSGEL